MQPPNPALLCALVVLASLATSNASNSYIDPGDEEVDLSAPDYPEDAIDQLLQSASKRACIRRGGNCDHRPSDCCHSSSCRCNLWGSNCRCQRMGLFQKWG